MLASFIMLGTMIHLLFFWTLVGKFEYTRKPIPMLMCPRVLFHNVRPFTAAASTALCQGVGLRS